MADGSARVKFLWAWALLLAIKLALAAHLPLFGDEAFYALESRRPAWAYSDLPGLTAWLAWLGLRLDHAAWALRLPFVLLGAALPWLVVRIAARWFGAAAGWQAGLLALLMPLGGLMGLLALPDVPMLVAALLALDAIAAMLARRHAFDAAQLALALALGALAHYRFAGVVAAGLAGLLCFARGRALLGEARTWAALAVGAAAWWPILHWNLAHAGAGVGFHLLERHPWAPRLEGIAWLPVQALLVTPPLFVLLLAVWWRGWRERRDASPAWPLLLGTGGVATLGWFALAFFADSERVSFHWPLAGWLALCCGAPPVLARWPAAAVRGVHAVAALGLLAMLGWLVAVATPAGRERLAATPAYADNFSGWDVAADATRAALAGLPADTRIVADNFMLGAQLAWALRRDDIGVAPHPLNAKHGRAVQLGDWGLLLARRPPGPVLLVVEDTARPAKDRLLGYRALCEWAGGLPPPTVALADGGRKRLLLHPLDADASAGGAPAPSSACTLPALGWIESPAPGERVPGELQVRGWALVPGGRVASVEIHVEGERLGQVVPDQPRPDVLTYWGLAQDPRVGFSMSLPRPDVRGRVRLGLVVVMPDGRREPLPTQGLVLP